LLLDGNAPWVRSLFSFLPGVREGRREVVSWRVCSVSSWLRCAARRSRPAPTSDSVGLTESVLLLPGWTLFGHLSTFLLSHTVARTVRRLGRPEAIVYTLPQYAGVASRFTDCLQAYYAYDAYRFYGKRWKENHINSLESEMLQHCNVIFAISSQLREDFQKLTTKPVVRSPNAASRTFIEICSNEALEPPADLLDLPGKIVGCIGQLCPLSYDWRLVEFLANRFPSVTFVFVGPMAAGYGAEQDLMDSVLGLRNVRWLGPKPHASLPRYLARFDICLSPLASNELNRRRSPLRLYDYLAGAKPILSTPLPEAYEHIPHLEIGATPSECADILNRLLTAEHWGDTPARREYILANTWETRARTLWAALRLHRRK
jgi:hypothetical protein